MKQEIGVVAGLDTRAAAGHVGCGPSLLSLMRRQGRGPKYYRVGRLVRYRAVDLEAWIAKNTYGGNVGPATPTPTVEQHKQAITRI